MKIKDLENSKFKRLIIYREALEMYTGVNNEYYYSLGLDFSYVLCAGLCLSITKLLLHKYNICMTVNCVNRIFTELNIDNRVNIAEINGSHCHTGYIAKPGELEPRIIVLKEAIAKIENSYTYKIFKTLRVI